MDLIASTIAGSNLTNSYTQFLNNKVRTVANTLFTVNSATYIQNAQTYVLVDKYGTNVYSSVDGITWKTYKTFCANGVLNQLTVLDYVNGYYIGISNYNVVISSDLVIWKYTTFTSNIRDLVCKKGLIVAVGDTGTLIRSFNGVDWTTVTTGVSTSLSRIIHANDLFVVSGYGGTIFTSVNGYTWTFRTSPLSAYDYYNVFYVNGLYIISGSMTGQVLISSNGETWSVRTFNDNTTLLVNDVTYANGYYVVAGTNSSNQSCILASSNNTTWITYYTSATNVAFIQIYNLNGLLVVIGSLSGSYWFTATSNNSVNWTVQTVADTPSTVMNIFYVNNKFIAVSNNNKQLVGTSITANNASNNWVASTALTSSEIVQGSNLIKLFFANNKYHAISNPTLLTSTNGTVWTVATNNLNNVTDLIYNAGTYVAVFSTGQIKTSTDGVVWNTQTSGISNSLNSITFINNRYIAVGNNNILTSTNGVSWNVVYTSGTAISLTKVFYNNGVYVAVGINSVLSSTDAVNWNIVYNATTSNFNFVYGNGLFVLIDNTNTVKTSIDTQSWTTTYTLPESVTELVYGNGLFVTTSNISNNIYTSANAVTWNTKTYTPTQTNSGVYYLNFIEGFFVANTVTPGIIVISQTGGTWTAISKPMLLNGVIYTRDNLYLSIDGDNSELIKVLS
jgi:hypothetical protein